MTRPNRSIRFRLMIWYSAVLFGSLCIFGLTIWLLLWRSLHADLDDALNKQARGLERYLALEASDSLGTLAHEMDEFAHSLPADFLMHVEDSSGRVLASSRNFAPQSIPRGYQVFRDTFEENNRRYTVTLAAPSTPADDTLNRLKWLLLAAVPGLVLAAAAGGFWMSSRALEPIARMTDTVCAIDFQNLSARLDVPHTGDEIQRLAETWNAMLQRIESAAGRTSRFTADASHELRTPLSLIKTSVDLALRRPRDAAEYQATLHTIGAETDRMTRLVESLLFLARTDAEASPRVHNAIDLSVTAQAAALAIMPKAQARNVTVNIHPAAEITLLQGDEDAICRLVVVLLDNAVKYSPKGGTVAVGCHKNVLHIHDTGQGIAPEFQERIFDRFYRADPSRTGDGESYGLGLAIAQAVARQHNASIAVDSRAGDTTFSVRFPAA